MPYLSFVMCSWLCLHTCMHACVARTNVLSFKRTCTYRPSLFFAYSPFNENAVCERSASDDVSTIVNLGLAISGAQGDHGTANGVLNALNGTTNSTNSSVSQEDLPLHDAKYCEFLDRAGYSVGMLNIVCFALIFVGLLLSPMRWWLYNRKVKKNRSDEFEQQEQEAMTRRRSSILGLSRPRPNLAPSPQSASQAPLRRRRSALDGADAVARNEALCGRAVKGVSGSSRISLGVLNSNDVMARAAADGVQGGSQKSQRKVPRSKSVLKAYQAFSETLLG